MSRGLKVCATIWLILLGLGSFIAAAIVWSNDKYGNMAGIGFGVLLGGALVALTGFFVMQCIAEIAEGKEVYHVDFSEEKVKKIVEQAVTDALSKQKKETKEQSGEENYSDILPTL